MAIRVKRKPCVSKKQSIARSYTLEKIYQILPTPYPDNPRNTIIYRIYGFRAAGEQKDLRQQKFE